MMSLSDHLKEWLIETCWSQNHRFLPWAKSSVKMTFSDLDLGLSGWKGQSRKSGNSRKRLLDDRLEQIKVELCRDQNDRLLLWAEAFVEMMFFELNFSLSKGYQADRSWKITSSKNLKCRNLVLMLLDECELRLSKVTCWSQKVKILPGEELWLTKQVFALHFGITRVLLNVTRQPAAPQVWKFLSSKAQLLTEPSGLFKNWRFKHFPEGEPLPENSNRNPFQAKPSWPKPA